MKDSWKMLEKYIEFEPKIVNARLLENVRKLY